MPNEKRINPDCPIEAFPIAGASLLAKFFASKLAPAAGSWPNGLSGINIQPSGVIRISGVMVIAWLALGRPLPASAAEEPAGSPEQPQLQLAPIRLQTYLRGNIDYYIPRGNHNGLKS